MHPLLIVLCLVIIYLCLDLIIIILINCNFLEPGLFDRTLRYGYELSSFFPPQTLIIACYERDTLDLDDTLYSSHTGIHKALKKNIEDFLVEVCGFTCDQASSMRVELFKAYGSTLAGLRALGYNIDADDYHSFVHGKLPYENIKPNPQLRNILLTITQRKIIFTNSDRVHAIKVLKRLGLEDCFEEIICFETLNPNLSMANYPEEIPIVLKPSLDAMEIAISAANINPRRTLFLDDNVRNVAAGKAMGLKTVLVGQTQKIPDADYALETVNNLAQTIPEIWMINRSDQDDQQIIRRSRSDLENLVTVSVVGA